jgi:hypothetical protein
VSSKLKKPSWTASLRIGRSSTPGEPLYDLDSFSDASIQQWQSYGRAVRDFHYALFFDLAGQRAARHKDLRDALQRVPPITISLEGWYRLVNFRYSYDALSPAGSLRWVGHRFNFGSDIDPARFPAFPALYLAEDFETAFREYHGLPKDKQIDGLRPDELSLEDRGNWATLQVGGHVNNVFDLTKTANLRGVCRIFSNFNLSDRVKRLSAKAKMPATTLVKTPSELLASIMIESWKSSPVHFDVPANSQVFAQLVVEAGFEGILYRSAKGAKKCLAVFTRQLGNSDSIIALRGEYPPGVKSVEISAANCLDI